MGAGFRDDPHYRATVLVLFCLEDIGGSLVAVRLLVTGDRDWADEKTMYGALLAFDNNRDWIDEVTKQQVTLVHGAARGADQMAERLAFMHFGWEVDPFEAEWEKYGKGAGAIRNQEMLDSGVDFALAFHANLKRSKGTLDMIERLLRANVPLELYPKS